jgi:preprotein translocase subunit Sec63
MQKMSKHIGKVVGVVLALLIGKFRSLPLVLIGLAIGHLYDRGFFSGTKAPADSTKPDHGDPYAVLGIDETASSDEVDTAYRRKMSDYHPDKVANAADEIKALAEVRAREINAAYEAIQKRRQQP